MEESTLGIDLASQPEKTAACRIVWSDSGRVVSPVVMPCTDADLDALIESSSVFGIDAPFGWPTPFVEAVADWSATQWSNELRDELRFRATDRFVREKLDKWPLSVSSDLIAIPAMRAQCLLKRFGVSDRSGDGKFFEVYPAASLISWDLASEGSYKGKEPDCLQRRREILAKLGRYLPSIPDDYAETDDALDALVAAITARCAQLGRTMGPQGDEAEVARVEGWIHLPTAGSLEQF